ncbi:hypothetical protein Zmor_023132 [Zophobas morio]|uniref:Protein translocase subunit SecA n=1 Tax=Zophobas morio TaxID=2755281 RepID=A0AA38HYQ5_9CUCU|nr:hypothetical protein Zmor_023132 [Zophobas morio]
MIRGDKESHDRERQEIADAGFQSHKIFPEAQEATLAKLFGRSPYEKNDIVTTAESLLQRAGYDCKTQLQVFENIDEFDEALTKDPKPVFFIYGKSKNCWVLFCLLTEKKTKKVLYKDSSGCNISQNLEDRLRRKLVSVDILANTERGHRVDEDYSYGPVCVRNLTIFLNGIKKDAQKFANEFLQQKFYSTADLNQDKLWNVNNGVNELSKNKEFLEELREFFNSIPSLEFTDDYNTIFEEELKKEEIDHERILKARKACYSKENLEKIKDSFKIDKAEDELEYSFQIEKKFPSEMKKLQNVLKLLNNIEVDDTLYKALEFISKVLHLDADKLKSYYKFDKEKGPKGEDKLVPRSISDIIQELPELKKPSPDACTPFDQLMEEMRLGMDPYPVDPNQDKEKTEDSSEQQQDKEEIEAKYHLVKSKYAQWKRKNIEDIRTWAVQIKGHLTGSTDDISEAIAIMDRAFNLLSGGFRLRDTQILAALIFLHKQENQGRLCQIQTGEGKTNIVSLLAVVKALQGFKVDVITSNPLLADDGVKETETFYSVFNLTVSTNNPSTNGESKIGYIADILYGTISNFQFDYLKDSFEGYTIRRNRPFGQVILDEVDSMLVDNGGHIAKLASPFPGMECLRYIYIKIWQALYKAEAEFVKENQSKFTKFLEGSPSEEEYERFIEDMAEDEHEVLKKKIKDSNPTNVPLVPLHLKHYIESKLDTWIKNAIHAKYNCHEHQQYRILENEATKEKFVAPVDYLNTGVTMKNTIWSNGLHQFVQLKHNLYLTFESLTSSFISNIGYIKNYDSKNIFGLTGTLGSRAEQDLLAHIYKVSYAKLPTYKEKKFEELCGVVVSDDLWSTQTTIEILKKIDQQRAVLAIFETEQDLLTIEENLNLLQCKDFRVRIYSNEDDAEETGEKVKVGDIILATNIAGRGTNFRTEGSLEETGGLHVLVAFLPCNKRVEDQAFGRTSRQGNSGSGQLVIRQSEVDELEINANADFEQIKRERDNLEKRRLEDINKVLVKELAFKDDLFKQFSKFYRQWKDGKSQREDEFVANDMKEFWAFWLEKKNYNIENIQGVKVDDAFHSFLKEADAITNGKISHNPFYSIGLSEFYLETDNTEKAMEELKHAIAVGKNHAELLIGANVKLFEVAILNGEQFKERFKKAIGKIFFIETHDTEAYKKEASEYLNKAKISIETEMNYFKNQFFNAEENLSEELKNILVTEDNPFVDHICSRYFALKIHQQNIDELLEKLKDRSVQLDIGGKVPTFLENLEKADPAIKEVLFDSELTELQSIGVDALYCLKEIPDVPDVVIDAARSEIIAGISLLCIGLIFPPAFGTVCGQAADLISGAIIDVVMAIIIPEEVNTHDYMKTKFISYGKSLVTLGFSAVTQCTRILKKAINYCRKLTTFLKGATKFKKVCESLAKLVEKLQKYLEKLLEVAKFNKLSKAAQLNKMQQLKNANNLDELNKLGGLKKLNELEGLIGNLEEMTRTDLLVDFVKTVSKQTAKSLTQSIVKTQIVEPLVDKALHNFTSTILEKITQSLKTSLQHESVLQTLKATKREEIDAAVEDFLEMNFFEEKVQKFAPKLISMLKKKLKLSASKVQILSIAVTAGIDLSELLRYGTFFAEELDKKLSGGESDNNVEEVVDEICSKVAAQMLEMMKKILSEGKDIGEVVVKDVVHGKNFHSVLGLDPQASIDEVKNRFRKIVLELHADKNCDPARIEEIKAAYMGIIGV